MEKILLFDFDDTLAYKEKGISKTLLKELKRLSKLHEVVIVTGREISYILGILRQAGGMEDVSIIGENGSVVSVGSSIPPEMHFCMTIDDDVRSIFLEIKNDIHNRFQPQEIWFQPKQVVFNAVPTDPNRLEELHRIFLSYKNSDLIIYKHTGSIEIMPHYVNKATGVKEYLKLLGYDREDFEIHAFGDSNNDIHMFKMADQVHIVGNKLNYIHEHTPLEDIEELIDFLNNNF